MISRTCIELLLNPSPEYRRVGYAAPCPCCDFTGLSQNRLTLRRAIPNAVRIVLPRAVGAAVDRLAGLDAMADDPAATVGAGRRQQLDRALEAVEHVRLAVEGHLERLVILVSAHLAAGHPSASFRATSALGRDRAGVVTAAAAAVTNDSDAPRSV